MAGFMLRPSEVPTGSIRTPVYSTEESETDFRRFMDESGAPDPRTQLYNIRGTMQFYDAGNQAKMLVPSDVGAYEVRAPREVVKHLPGGGGEAGRQYPDGPNSTIWNATKADN
jgi:hypothetical protein